MQGRQTTNALEMKRKAHVASWSGSPEGNCLYRMCGWHPRTKQISLGHDYFWILVGVLVRFDFCQ